MIERDVLHAKGKLMVVKVRLKKGDTVGLHTHFEEQISYLEKGKLELIVYDEKKTYSAGEIFHIPSNVMHGVVVLEDCEILDIFSPIRKDIL